MADASLACVAFIFCMMSVWRTAKRYTHRAVATLNKINAEEVAQEAVLKAFKSISAFGEKRGSAPG